MSKTFYVHTIEQNQRGFVEIHVWNCGFLYVAMLPHTLNFRLSRTEDGARRKLLSYVTSLWSDEAMIERLLAAKPLSAQQMWVSK